MNRPISFDSPSMFYPEVEMLCASLKSRFEKMQKEPLPQNDAIEINILFERHGFSFVSGFMDKIITSFIGFLSEKELEFFHNTRLATPLDLSNGLCVLSKHEYILRISKILNDNKVPLSSIAHVCELVEPYLEDLHGTRKGILSFFAPYSQRYGWEKFWNNIGGEVAEFALKTKEAEAFRFLSNVGNPYTIKVSLPFSNIDHSGSTDFRIIMAMIKSFFARKYLDVDYSICVDCYTKTNVPKSNILEVIAVR